MGVFSAIAKGALKIGGKIIEKIKDKRDAKVEKKAAQLVAAQNKQQEAYNMFGDILGAGNASSQSISGAGNLLAGLKSALLGAAPAQAIAPQPAVSGASPNGSFLAEMGSLAGNGVRASKASYKEVRDQREGGGAGGNNKMLLIIGGAALVLLLIFKKR